MAGPTRPNFAGFVVTVSRPAKEARDPPCIMKTLTPTAILAIAATLASTGPASVHPHVFAETRLEVEVNPLIWDGERWVAVDWLVVQERGAPLTDETTSSGM